MPTPQELHDAIAADPALAALAASGADSAVAAALNAPHQPGPRSGTWATELGILAILGPVAGEAALQGLEAAAGSNAVIARVLRILKQASGVGNPAAGIDLGSPAVRAMISALSGTALDAASAAALLAAGSRMWSRAEALWGEGTRIAHEDVAAAMRGA